MSDRDRIREIEERIMAAFAAGDAEAIAAQYTEDAVLMAPEMPAVHGRSAIADTYRPTLEEFTVLLQTEVDEMEIAGDWAWIRGRFENTVVPKSGGEASRGRGKYLAVARRGADGVWRFHRDAFNLDEPLAAAQE